MKKRKLQHQMVTDPPPDAPAPSKAKQPARIEIDLTEEPPKASPSMAAPSEPTWKGLRGSKRLMAELKFMYTQIEKRATPICDLQLVNEDLHKWQFKLKHFDEDSSAGRDLNTDLKRLKAEHNLDHILMEVKFPSDYPNKPFFVRVVRPRMLWYTGHITAGGSICIESLTLSGTQGSWQPEFCFEGIINTIIANILDETRVMIRTATGPGGMSGPLRIDLDRHYSHSVTLDYSEHEANAAFSRMEAHHRSNGW